MLIKSQKITLWTIQHQDFYKTLIQEKIVYAALRPEIDSEYLIGYEWLRKQMDNKIGKRPFPTCYPIWAWYQWNGIQQAKPDLRYSCHLNKGTPGVRLTIQKEIREVLLSDFILWHSPYCYHYYIAVDELQDERFEQKLKDLNLTESNFEQFPHYLQREIEQSWQHIFDLDYNFPACTQPYDLKSIQATFWSLSLDEVIKVEKFIAR